MADQATRAPRTFKSKWFTKAARQAGIIDAELCEAMREVRAGQADDLGGGVWKKRLNKNQHRSIILAKGKQYWVFEYLFAKKDRANIEHDELAAFRRLAAAYEGLTTRQVADLQKSGAWKEICHDDEAEVQE